MSLPPLPRTPQFPVYALDESWTGPRWLELWNWLHGPDPHTPGGGRLWEVVIGHGSVLHAPTAVVTTVAQHERVLLPGGGAVGPTGLDDAALSAFLGLLHRLAPGTPGDPSRLQWFREQMASPGKMPGPPVAEEWTSAVVQVNGQPVAFQQLRRETAWAAAAEIGTVAVGVWADGIDVADIRLVAVDPTRYPIGSGE